MTFTEKEVLFFCCKLLENQFFTKTTYTDINFPSSKNSCSWYKFFTNLSFMQLKEMFFLHKKRRKEMFFS